MTVTVDPTPYEDILYRRLRSDLVTDVVQLALSMAAVWLLAGWLQRPVRKLTRQVDAMSGQRLPEPVPVPGGRDEFTELAAAFNRMTGNVQEAFRRETAFTRYASHELRTPLSAIALQVESLRLGTVDRRTAADVLERNVRRMQRVLDALLNLTRIGDRGAEPARVDHLLDDLLESIEAPDRQRVCVHTQAPGASIPRPDLVAQAIRNLLDNALKHTRGSVRLTCRDVGGNVRIGVRDQGPGVPEDVLGLLTRPYVRGASRSEGSGLGLAFVNQVADALHGGLELRNLADGFEAELIVPVTVRSAVEVAEDRA